MCRGTEFYLLSISATHLSQTLRTQQTRHRDTEIYIPVTYNKKEKKQLLTCAYVIQ